jgi:hypothetical protein
MLQLRHPPAELGVPILNARKMPDDPKCPTDDENPKPPVGVNEYLFVYLEVAIAASHGSSPTLGAPSRDRDANENRNMRQCP